MKKKNKGFTLIELLAVIVILGLLMAIAIPSVTKYITQSRKKTLTNTIGNYMGALVNEVNDMTYTFTGTNTIYAVPIECIAVERGGTNPFGKWYQANNSYWAYVLVQYDDLTSSYKYGFTFKDSAGYGLYPTTQAKINEKGSQIVTGLNLSRPKNGLVTEITPLSNWTGFDVNSTTQLKVLTAGSEDQVGDGVNTCTLVQKGDNYNQVEEEKENNPVTPSPSGTTAATTIKEKVNGTTLAQHSGIGANDGSYRYSGANPNNYVCFGSDESTCPTENLYRIIGVFDNNVKLIKSSFLEKKYWNGTGSQYSGNVVTMGSTKYENYWYYKDSTTGLEIESTLNQYLNNDFYNSIDSKWQNMIVIYEWNIGGGVTYDAGNAMVHYNSERQSKWLGKIGLMSPSEYGFSANKSYWDINLIDYKTEASTTDWLKSGDYEWTIARATNYFYSSFTLSSSGAIGTSTVFSYSDWIRPAFYLSSSVKIISGTGEQANPYRLSM